VYAAALRAAGQLPHLPAAYNTLGLALEAHSGSGGGNVDGAVQAYRTAASLLSQQPAHHASSTRLLTLGTASKTASSDVGTNGCGGEGGEVRSVMMQAVRRNLARALVRARRYVEAIEVFEQLVAAGGGKSGDTTGDGVMYAAYAHALLQASAVRVMQVSPDILRVL
jgi:pentatricopeptide repeat protein